ncbi:MAG: CPBP family intramembrane glutamic endopeptidase [Planctomycetota bacterium]|nr:CPBP family intramembrane glutamic endopeptidase [Planctomycetota bacterium]
MTEAAPRSRFAILQLTIVILTPSLGALCALWFWPGPVGGVLYASCKVVLYGIPLWILWTQLGLRGLLFWPLSGASSRVLAIGSGSGVLIGGGIWAIWAFLLSSRIDVSPLVDVLLENGMSDHVKFWAFAVWLCLGNSLLEEIVFRWYVDSRLCALGFRLPVMLALSGMIFTAHHVIVLAAYFSWPMVVLGSLGVFAGGVIWSIFRIRHRTLLPGWISHALVDVAVVLIGWSILSDQLSATG